MAIVNTSKPTTTYSNTSRPASYETWATITTTWATETRTWIDTISFIDNVTRQSSSITNTAKP